MKKILSILSLGILLFGNLTQCFANSSFTEEELGNMMLNFLNAEVEKGDTSSDVQEAKSLKTSEIDKEGEDELKDEIEYVGGDKHIIWNKTKGIITIYTGDFSYGVTIEDKNLGATTVGTGEESYGKYYQYGNNNGTNIGGEITYDLLIRDEKYSKGYNGDITAFIAGPSKMIRSGYQMKFNWGGENDSSSNNYGYDVNNHKVTEPEQRQGPCKKGYHVPSRGEFEELMMIFGNNIGISNDNIMLCKKYHSCNFFSSTDPRSNDDAKSFIDKLNLPLAGQRISSDGSYKNYRGFYRLSTKGESAPMTRVNLSNSNDGINYFVNADYTARPGEGFSVRCFKNEYIPYSKTVTFNPNGGAFSGMEVNQTKNYTYTADENGIVPIYNIQIPNRISKDISQQSGWMFAGWYTKDGTNDDWGEEFDQYEQNANIVYAKWLKFNDIDLSIIGLTGIKIMDRNLGAEKVAEGTYHEYDGTHEDWSKLGFYYQWGNNYGFKNTGDLENTGNELVSNTSENPWGPGNYYYNNKFIIKSDETQIRDSENNLNLWGGENIDSPDNMKKGPCPDGYHVPNNKERLSIILAFNSERVIEGNNICEGISDTEYGKCLTKNLNIPFAGFRQNSDASLSPAGNIVSYWSSTPLDNKYSYKIQIQHNNIFIGNTTHTYGEPIRCFKDTENGELRIKGNELKEDITYPVKWRKGIEEYANILTNIGYEFIGLYNDNLYQTEVDKKFPIGKQKTIYSKWKQNPWYSYNANGGIFQDGTNLKIKKSNLKETKIEVSNENYTGTSHIEVIKLPGAKKYYITGTRSQTCINYINIYDFDKTGKDGNVFKKIEPYCNGGTCYRDFDFVIDSDVISIETIKTYCPAPTYNANIVGYGPYEIENNDENPESKGYTFSGWYETGEVGPFDFNNTPITKDRTLYAKWNPHHYTIKFNINGGTGDTEDKNATYGEEINIPNVTREGYTFRGWQSEDGVLYNKIIPEGTGVTTEDGVTVTLTAQWDIIPPSAGGGSTINPTKHENKATEQEHNSADTVKETETTKQKSTPKETTNQSVEEKIQTISPKSLTRGELAVFSNILLDIFPKLAENKKNVNEVCTEYTDYQEFSSKEQKAVSKLCRLAIMGINEDDKTPLETFGVHNLTNNKEFIKVVNRMTDKYSEEELKDLKSALSSLEENKEENLSFGTVVNNFKKVKNLFE